ncbi:MAG: NeuD/PglB/VioB family sugar acetyltransferase [Lachnospiraceae bacterium]|nr:NeuD/PglB/VioB family sugar acetyltransferase [Lachnospiraceae bacterium]
MILGIYCAGNLGREIYEIACRINKVNRRWEEIVFLDDVYEGDMFYGARVLKPDIISFEAPNIEAVIANGTPKHRQALREKVSKLGIPLTNLIDPTSIISSTATLGNGVIVTPFSTICCDVCIGDNVHIQSYVRVGHDIVIGNDSVLSSNVAIGGKTKVGMQTYVGLGAVIRDGLYIGNNSIISMGAVVHTDVDDGVTVVGSPARVSKRNESGTIFR